MKRCEVNHSRSNEFIPLRAWTFSLYYQLNREIFLVKKMKFYLEGINILLPSCAQHISWKSARYILMFLIHKSTFALISPNMGSEDITNRILKHLLMRYLIMDWGWKKHQLTNQISVFRQKANLNLSSFVLIWLLGCLFLFIPTTPYARVHLLFPFNLYPFPHISMYLWIRFMKLCLPFHQTLYTIATKMCLSFWGTHYILFCVKNVMWLSFLIFVLSKSILAFILLWSSVFSKEVEEELIGSGIPEPSD